MRKWLSYLIVPAILISMAIAVIGETTVDTDSGVTVNWGRGFDFGTYLVGQVDIFEDYDPGSDTMVYNSAGGSAEASGSMNTERFVEKRAFQIQVSTLGSDGMDVKIEGKVGTDTNWAPMWEKSYAATGSDIVDVGTETDNIRVGLQSTGTDSVDLISVHAKFRGKK